MWGTGAYYFSNQLSKLHCFLTIRTRKKQLLIQIIQLPSSVDFRLRGASLGPHWKAAKSALNRIPIKNFHTEETSTDDKIKDEPSSDEIFSIVKTEAQSDSEVRIEHLVSCRADSLLYFELIWSIEMWSRCLLIKYLKWTQIATGTTANQQSMTNQAQAYLASLAETDYWRLLYWLLHSTHFLHLPDTYNILQERQRKIYYFFLIVQSPTMPITVTFTKHTSLHTPHIHKFSSSTKKIKRFIIQVLFSVLWGKNGRLWK